MKQTDLFAVPAALPAGFEYRPAFVTPEEERSLLEIIETLPLREASYKEYKAKRRIASFGGRYDFTNNELLPAGPIPEFLHPLRERVARLIAVPVSAINHALIAEYRPGTQLGWHRDVPEFEIVAGISLAAHCRMRLRPWPPQGGRDPRARALDLEPRSVYVMRGQARWGWQHAISPTKALRYSITFRTLARTRG